MNASPRQQQLLLELQRIDTQKIRINRRLAQLPERKELESMSGTTQQTREQFMRAQRALEELQTEIERLQDDVNTVKQREIRTTGRLSGSTQAKEAALLQEELTTLDNRKRLLEDREIEFMEQIEEAQQAFNLAVVGVSDADAEVQRLLDVIHEAETLAQTEIDELTAERDGLAAEIQGPVLEVFERTQARYGIGAARLNGRVSEGSNMELDASDYQALMQTPEDELYFCPNSGAILVRVAEATG